MEDSQKTPLPVDVIRDEFLGAVNEGPIVLAAPTGSGKSTQVPRWCAGLGRTLVVEPRRVACRSLAAWVAKLECTALGERVGYVVRDDKRASPESKLVFATPGVVLRWMQGGEKLPFDAVIVDEFHERGLETDLILALLKLWGHGRLVVMSATLDAERLGRHLDARVITAKGRSFPVTVDSIPNEAMLPDARGLEERVLLAVKKAEDLPGDILVFMPGKAEISRTVDLLHSKGDWIVMPMHGGLTLEEQSRVFEGTGKRKIVVSTNVAETSLTIPGIGVVIDSGLVRRTRYINGRGHLTLVPVAMDSAVQRAGRSGRTGPGHCFRLWSPKALLEERTPPEIHREALSPLLLAAANCGARMEDLPFLDPPKPYAVDSAREDQVALGALDEKGGITERGKELFAVPLDAALGNLIVEARKEGVAEAAVDLVSALAVGRPLFEKRRPLDPKDDLRDCGCDVLATIRAVREGDPRKNYLAGHVLKEARTIRRRLYKIFGLSVEQGAKGQIDIRSLMRAALKSDPRVAYVARRRKSKTRFGNGGTEIELAKESAVDQEKPQAVVVLMSIAVGIGPRKTAIVGTCASPVSFGQLYEAGLGRDRVANSAVKGGAIVSTVERVFANAVIGEREEIPKGDLASHALVGLIAQGRIFSSEYSRAANTIEAIALLKRLKKAGLLDEYMEIPEQHTGSSYLSPAEWLARRVDELGVESGEDLSLITGRDFSMDPLSEEVMNWLDSKYPRRVPLGDGEYRVDYDTDTRTAVFEKVSGTRKNPPSLSVLPSCPGFKIKVRHHSKVWVLRDR